MDRTIQKALGLQMNGFNEEALNIFENAIKKEPHNLILCEYYGGALAASGKFNRAKKYLKKALSATVEKPQVLNNLATVNRQLGLIDEALLNAKSALKFKPNYADAWVNRANLHSDLRQWDEACKCFENAIKLNPKDPEPYIHLSNAYLHSLNFEKALAFNKNCQSKFRNPFFLVSELICYRAMENYDKALNFAEKLKEKFDDKIMWFEWIQTLWMAKEFEKVRSEADIAVEKFGRYPELVGILNLLEQNS